MGAFHHKSNKTSSSKLLWGDIQFPSPSSIPLVPSDNTTTITTLSLEPMSPSTTIFSSSSSNPQISKSTAILLAILLVVTSFVVSLALWKIHRHYKLLNTTLSSCPSESSIQSWETVVVDLPSLLDPPEPAVAGLGKLWARVKRDRTNHNNNNPIEPMMGALEDSALGPLEWYAKHAPPEASPMVSRNSCHKSPFLLSYDDHQSSRSWTPPT